MTLNTPLSAVGIIASNSIGYIEELFKAYRQQKLVISLDSPEDAVSIAGVEFSEIITPKEKYGWYQKRQIPLYFDKIAQISFTSGTEGEPKGILISHRNLANVTTRLNKIMQLDDSVREYIGVPLKHSFGQARLRAVAAVNGASFIPEKGFNPLEIAKMLQKDEINSISTVPSLWRLILENKELFANIGEKLNWIEIGSQYMSAEEKEELKKLFSKAKIIQHYGLTEASRTTFLNISTETGSALSSVGRALDKIEIAITENDTIKIKGPHVATQALVDGKIIPLTDKDGWLHTNDLGKIKNGLLYFEGRNDDMINCGGLKIAAEYIEVELGKKFGEKNKIAVGRIADKIRGDGIIVCYEPSTKHSKEDIQKATNEILKNKNIQIGNALKIVAIDQIPRTDNGKIKRKDLEKFANKTEGKEATVKENDTSLKNNNILTDQQRELIDIWREILAVDTVSIHSSFYDFGGDSLSTINLMLRMEKSGIDKAIINDIINGKSIAEVTDSQQSNTNETIINTKIVARTSEAINVTRGIMMMILIFIHWSPALFERLSIDYIEITNPLFRMGTPGFALIFGLGTGFFIFHQFSVNYKKAIKNLRVALIMLAIGIGLFAVVRYFNMTLTGIIPDVELPAALFFSVLLYYFLAVLTVPIWYFILSRFKNMAEVTLAASAIMFGASIIAKFILPTSEGLKGFMMLGGLMIEAKYNYFLMTATVFLGLSLGIYIRKLVNAGKSPNGLFASGVATLFFGILWSFQSGQSGEWLTTGVATIWMNICYFGVITIILSAALKYNEASHDGTFSRLIFQMLAIFGLLSLPLYIGHGLVRPARDLIVTFGLPASISLLISISVFISVIGAAFMKLYKIYYGQRKITA
ncbi:MAG: AMP-binding protein [Kordiimonadaceae bacterium]|nr:AMP-binding protein [Kordiimonadaceae bacterium]